jgi:guanosine-3',5'-bis(diphosphate) 3'-pyrophosphohydrolase
MNFSEYKNKLAFFANNNFSTLSTFDSFILGIKDPLLKQSIIQATLFAAEAHFGQTRNQDPQIPYIVHPLRVSYLLWKEASIENSDILVAALLHDIFSKNKISDNFGSQVVHLVEELTDKEKPTPLEEAHKASLMSKDAKTIKLADRTHNLRDLIDHPPQIWNFYKIKKFLSRSELLFEKLKGTHLTLETAYLDAIKALNFL